MKQNKHNIFYLLSYQSGLYFDIMIQILSLAKANDMCKDVETTGRIVHVKHLSSQRGSGYTQSQSQLLYSNADKTLTL